MRLLVSSLLVCAVALGCQQSQPPSATSDGGESTAQAQVPDPVTTGAEPLVIEKIRSTRRAVLDRPDSAAAWGKLGMVLDVHNYVDGAAICYAEAERLSPADFRWPYFAALCMPNASPEEQTKTLQRAVKLRPEYAPASIRLGQSLLQSQDYDNAQSMFEASSRKAEFASHALLGLGRIAIARSDMTGARKYLEQAAAANPDHREVFAMLASVYRALEEIELANAAAQRAARLQGKTPLVDPARTEVMFEGVSASQLARQGNRLREMQRFEEAIEKLRLSIRTRPDNPMAHFDLGLALASLGQWEEGIAELKEALRIDERFEPARQALKAVIAERDRLR
jgi:tetratricopeptide (TPR) repeat protein